MAKESDAHLNSQRLSGLWLKSVLQDLTPLLTQCELTLYERDGYSLRAVQL